MRASKTVNGSTLKQIWDGTNIVAETDESGAVTAKYYRGISLISQERSGRVSYYQFNGHGDVTGLTDTSGNVTASYQYDAFGVEINPNQSDPNPFRYCGEYFDNETNNIYLRNRYYSPGNGRFITEDPAKDGGNWYVYCNGDPVNYVDPTGTRGIALRDYVQSNGGSVSWNAYTKKATVRINGRTLVYYHKDWNFSTIVDGTLYVEESTLCAQAGLYYSYRKQAVDYALAYGNSRNPEYNSYDNNCANFVSQCLIAGGMQMDAEWWYVNRPVRPNRPAWGVADDLYKYLTGTLNFSQVKIEKGADICDVANQVQPGDAIFWSEPEEFYLPNQVANHTGIVTKVEDGNIYYSGNTNNKTEAMLFNSELNGDLYIVKIQYPDEDPR